MRSFVLVSLLLALTGCFRKPVEFEVHIRVDDHVLARDRKELIVAIERDLDAMERAFEADMKVETDKEIQRLLAEFEKETSVPSDCPIPGQGNDEF